MQIKETFYFHYKRISSLSNYFAWKYFKKFSNIIMLNKLYHIHSTNYSLCMARKTCSFWFIIFTIFIGITNISSFTLKLCPFFFPENKFHLGGHIKYFSFLLLGQFSYIYIYSLNYNSSYVSIILLILNGGGGCIVTLQHSQCKS